MSEKPMYPSLTDTLLVPFRALEAQLGAFPDLLDRPDCPYPDHIEQFLRKLLLDAGAAPAERREYDEEDLVREISDLYDELRGQNSRLNTGDAKDKIAMLKVTADLLTKMVSLKERALNIREMSRFQKLVLEVLETVISPAQRAEFIEKLEKKA